MGRRATRLGRSWLVYRGTDRNRTLQIRGDTTLRDIRLLRVHCIANSIGYYRCVLISRSLLQKVSNSRPILRLITKSIMYLRGDTTVTALANEALDNNRNSEESSADERKEPTPKETDCRIGVQ